MDAKSLEYEAKITQLTQELALRAEQYTSTLAEYRNALKSQRAGLISYLATNTAYISLFDAVREIGTDIANETQQALESGDPAAIAVAEKLERYANALAQALQDSVNARQSTIEEQRSSLGLTDEDLRQ